MNIPVLINYQKYTRPLIKIYSRSTTLKDLGLIVHIPSACLACVTMTVTVTVTVTVTRGCLSKCSGSLSMCIRTAKCKYYHSIWVCWFRKQTNVGRLCSCVYFPISLACILCSVIYPVSVAVLPRTVIQLYGFVSLYPQLRLILVIPFAF